jgi:hypothetical protein
MFAIAPPKTHENATTEAVLTDQITICFIIHPKRTSVKQKLRVCALFKKLLPISVFFLREGLFFCLYYVIILGVVQGGAIFSPCSYPIPTD